MRTHLVVGDHEDGVSLVAQPVDGSGHVPQSVHVQARVNLVQNGKLRLNKPASPRSHGSVSTTTRDEESEPSV